MNKILVEVFLPASGNQFDTFISPQSKLNEVIVLLSKVAGQLSGGKYAPTDDAILCDRVTGAIFSINISVHELGLKNGSKLMLI